MKIVFITGPSGSGKTTISKHVSKNLINSHVLSTDNYYKTGFISKLLSKFINCYFDKILSHNQKLIKEDINYILKNKSIYHNYKYDFINKFTEKCFTNVSNIQTLIIEGIFSLELTDFFSENKYVLVRIKEKKNICRERVYQRDSIERCKNKTFNFNEFNNCWNIYQEKEKAYKSKIRRGITLTKSNDLKNLCKILSK